MKPATLAIEYFDTRRLIDANSISLTNPAGSAADRGPSSHGFRAFSAVEISKAGVVSKFPLARYHWNGAKVKRPMTVVNRGSSDGRQLVINSPSDIAKNLQNSGGGPIDGGQLVISPRRAQFLLDIGKTRLYELIDAGEINSFLEGRSRKITTVSIRRFIERRLAHQRAMTGK